MKYVIYELVQPSHLKEIEEDGYHLKTVYRNVLQKLDIPRVESEHLSMQSAVAEITDKKDLLRHLELTVIPVFSISWNGEIN